MSNLPTEFESDELLRLLTDALRAGPSSPAWDEALARLGRNPDEREKQYQLLMTARERLEQGRDWRKVHAGPGFTRDLMAALDQDEASKPGGLPVAGWLAVVALGMILIGSGALIWHFTRDRAPAQNANTTSPLLGTLIASAQFDRRPDDPWRVIGGIPLEFQGAMRPAAGDAGRGGGILLETPINPDQPLALEAVVRVRRLAEQPVLQLFVSTDEIFDPQSGVGERELAAVVGGGSVRVQLPDGRLVGDIPNYQPNSILRLQWRLTEQTATLLLNGRAVWTGPHTLPDDQPRRVGVRFLRERTERGEFISVERVDVFGP